MTAILDLFNLTDNRIVGMLRSLTGLPWLLANAALLLFLSFLALVRVVQYFLQSPAYWIDAVFFYAAPRHPALLLLACLQCWWRRWPWLCGGFLGLLGVERVTWGWCQVFPGARVWLGDGVMSGDEDEELRTSTELPEPAVVRADTDAERTSRTSENVPPAEPSLHNLSRQELITLLAVQKDTNGKYRYSGNDIVSFVGGTRAETLDLVGQVRGTKKESQSRSMGRSARPENGW